MRQVERDAQLIADKKLKCVVWHFYVAASNNVGPSEKVLAALKAKGIPYHVHWA